MDKPTLADATYKTHEQARKDAEAPAAPVKLIGRITGRPWFKHLIRMFGRDADRLGSSFAAAITYFTLASLVPILGLAFSVTGIVLNSQPQLIATLKEQVTSVFAASGGEFSDNISKIIDTAVEARWAVGIVSLVIGLYTGISWMTNIRTAVQAQWRPRWEVKPEDQDTFLGGLRKDLTALVVLGLGILVSVLLSTIGTALTGVVARLLGLDDVGWVTAVLRIVPILLALCVSIALFTFLYTFLPVHSDEVPRRAIWRGAIAAAIIFELFKLLLSTLLQLLGGSASVAAFGSIIVLLAIVNLIARMVLLVAAWIGTSDAPAVPDLEDEVALLVQPEYRPRSVPALAGGLGVGVAAGWVARSVRRRRAG